MYEGLVPYSYFRILIVAESKMRIEEKIGWFKCWKTMVGI